MIPQGPLFFLYPNVPQHPILTLEAALGCSFASVLQPGTRFFPAGHAETLDSCSIPGSFQCIVQHIFSYTCLQVYSCAYVGQCRCVCICIYIYTYA